MFTFLISITFLTLFYFILYIYCVHHPTFFASSRRSKWKVKWNKRFVNRRKSKEHRDVNEHFKLHDEIENYIKEKDVS